MCKKSLHLLNCHGGCQRIKHPQLSQMTVTYKTSSPDKPPVAVLHSISLPRQTIRGRLACPSDRELAPHPYLACGKLWETANVWPKCPLTMGFHSFALVFNIPSLIWINQKSHSLHQGVNMSKINFLNFCDHSRWLRKWGLRHPEGTSPPPSAHWVWPTGSLRARLVCEDYNP